MFAIPPPMQHRPNLPQRTDSLGAVKAATFSQIEEELRDVKRVHSHGQEEDLRMALSRTISRVEELVRSDLAYMIVDTNHGVNLVVLDAERGIQSPNGLADRAHAR
jgi:hypothetical protein